MKQMWVCEHCGATHLRYCRFDCPVCGKESCNSCAWTFAHHKECAVGKTDKEMCIAAGMEEDWPELAESPDAEVNK